MISYKKLNENRIARTAKEFEISSKVMQEYLNTGKLTLAIAELSSITEEMKLLERDILILKIVELFEKNGGAESDKDTLNNLLLKLGRG
ncbi:MAG: hypothetical protein WC511_01995 [Candidatus Pacearchaeota archaeon]